jgi:predicted TIM-barrel fold metal-dependent hydrolase
MVPHHAGTPLSLRQGGSVSLIDFHSHYYDPAWMPAVIPRGFSAAMHAAWPILTNIDAQLAAMDAAGVEMKVLSAPLSTLVDPGDEPPTDLSPRINERFAALIAMYPDRLLGLASIDGFGGDESAREVERAVRDLHLSGICVDCARGDRHLDAPEARPVLDACAALDVPIFVHPVSPPGYAERLARHGQVGVLMARGTEGAASILALLRSGTLAALPELRVVIPMMSASVLLFAGLIDIEQRRDGGPADPPRSGALHRLFIDTMGFDSETIRFAVRFVGADHVVVGSDWPILPIPDRAWVLATLAQTGLSEGDCALISSGNARRILHHG